MIHNGLVHSVEIKKIYSKQLFFGKFREINALLSTLDAVFTKFFLVRIKFHNFHTAYTALWGFGR